MHSIKVLFFATIISFVFCSCTGDSAPADKPKVTTTPAVKPLGKLVSNTLPSISEEIMQNMWNTCTNIDFLFYNYSFSMNQTEAPSIKNTLTYISTSVPPQLDDGCSPVGRIFFVANGEGLTEAEFYLGTICNYFIFFKDGKPVAANMMTPKGEEFLKGTIQRVNSGIPK